jgi:hypothetical protein
MAGHDLRRRFADGELVVAPGVYDMISALTADRMGFPALYMTGYGTVASYLGVPDAGIATYTEMLDRVAKFAEVRRQLKKEKNYAALAKLPRDSSPTPNCLSIPTRFRPPKQNRLTPDRPSYLCQKQSPKPSVLTTRPSRITRALICHSRVEGECWEPRMRAAWTAAAALIAEVVQNSIPSM